MRKELKAVVLGLAVMGMGVSMPSCPGQKAMEQQIEALQTSNADLNKKVQALTTQLNTLNGDMTQVKQLLPQMTNVIQAQKGALDQLEATVNQMKGKGAKKKR